MLAKTALKGTMSHFKQYQGDAAAKDGRNLGDEWLDWDGAGEGVVNEGKGLFLGAAAAFACVAGLAVAGFMYLVTPRLAMWHPFLPNIAWGLSGILIVLILLSFAQLVLTASAGRALLGSPFMFKKIYEIAFSGVFRIAQTAGISRDRMGHSFIKVSNSVSRALKHHPADEKLLILLPRCLTKEQLSEINSLNDKYPITIHTVSGGELARKKVKELRPTAVIGVACERDLVSGIRDVGSRFSVIGITNQRPDGPCRNTFIDMKELIDSIEFFTGPATVDAAKRAGPTPQA